VKWKENSGKCVEGPEELGARVGSRQEPKLSGLLLIFLISHFFSYEREKIFFW
jgi:hypothetical protein